MTKQHNSDRVLEPEIKSALINKLREQKIFDDKDHIINEFNVGDYSRRVDLLLLKKDRLLAFEIKSDADSLTRLSFQVEKYLEYFDKVIVVVAERHTQKALKLTPNNVAIWESSGCKIKVVRRGKIKKSVNKKKLVELMTAYELKKLCKDLRIFTHDKKRSTLEHALLNSPISKLRERAISCIKSRYQSTNKSFLTTISNRPSTPEDLKLLRLTPEREENHYTQHKISSFINALEPIIQNQD